jgi:pyridoxal phosphate enzyme (YggS family)
VSPIAEALREQHERIARAAARAGRPAGSVRLIAVSKTKPAALIREAYEAGQRDFGENYVQELVKKAEELADLPELRFHMIGHLQRNKARQVTGLVSAVHTVDGVRLAEELGKRAQQKTLPVARVWTPAGARAEAPNRLPVLVEVNVSGESSKSGCAPSELGAVLEAVEKRPSLTLSGLMTVPPASDDAEAARPFFEQLVELQRAHGGATRLPELSMGMSHDLEVAVACGATCVRVGTAIFGARDYAAASEGTSR